MKTFSLYSAAAWLVMMMMTMAAPGARAQSIANPGFEVNGFSLWPGYASNNGGVITGWTFAGAAGLNPAASDNPFANNGAVPQGVSVAFLQSGGNIAATLETTMTGLTPGYVYRVRFRANSRAGYAEPVASWALNGGPLVYFTAWPAAGALNGYHHVTGTFTATVSTATLRLSNQTAEDTTLLVDDFSVAAEVTSGWAVSAWRGDATSGLSPQTEWAWRFGSPAGTTINGVAVNGVDGPDPAEPGVFATTGFPNIYNEDDNNLTAVRDSPSGELARNFLWGGSQATITLQGLVPGNTYIVSLFSVGWDPVAHRPVTFSSGGQESVVEQNVFGENNGLRLDYTFFAEADTRVLTLTPLVMGSTFHLYGIALRQPLLVTSIADTGAGSLREAIATAAAQPGPDYIAFAPPLSGLTIMLGSKITLNDPASVVIDATTLPAGLTLDRSGGHHHFVFEAGAICALRGLTVTTRVVPSGGSVTAIDNHGTLDLMRCTFSNNPGVSSGAIISYGPLTATDCIFSGNSAAETGGAIFNSDGTLTLTRCTFSGNTARTVGGAIYQFYGHCVMTHCTFAGNSAGNSPAHGTGGAIGCGIHGPGANLILTHCTFSGNSAGKEAGAICFGNNLGALTLTNCIVAGNTAPAAADIQFRGHLIRAGANVIQSVENVGAGSDSGPAAIIFDPLLAPLANYGGLTATMALRPGSPALNAAVGPAPVLDQRGFPLVGLADIGAYEAGTRTNCAANLAETLPPTVPAAAVGPAGDFDGDGSPNEQECNALTNPSSAASFFRILTTVRTGADIVITFPTVSGRHYTLASAHFPAGTWTDTGLIPVTGNGTSRTFSIPAPSPGSLKSYYRVQARP